MPNWCANTLEVSGPKNSIKEFRDKVVLDPKKEITIMETLLPLPEGSTRMEGEYSVFTEEGWRTANELWGTKWGDCNTQLWNDEPESLIFAFDSAWGPPLNGIQNISKMFPKLTFSIQYNEPGNAFRGKGIARNGKIISDVYDDNFQLDIDTLKKAGYTTDEQMEEANEMMWEYYGELVDDLSMNSVDITNFVIDKLKEEKGE